MEYAAESRQSEIVEDLMKYFLKQGLKDCFSALLYKCFDLLRPDVVLELAWKHNIVDCAMPFIIQTVRDFGSRVGFILISGELFKTFLKFIAWAFGESRGWA